MEDAICYFLSFALDDRVVSITDIFVLTSRCCNFVINFEVVLRFDHVSSDKVASTSCWSSISRAMSDDKFRNEYGVSEYLNVHWLEYVNMRVESAIFG